MKQTPAAMLILAASICAHGTVTRTLDSVGILVGLMGTVLAAGGIFSLVTACVHQHSKLAHGPDPMAEFPSRDSTGLSTLPASGGVGTSRLESTGNGHERPGNSYKGQNHGDYRLSPETRAQLSLVAHVRGQDRTQIVEEVLRRHLPRFTNPRSS